MINATKTIKIALLTYVLAIPLAGCATIKKTISGDKDKNTTATVDKQTTTSTKQAKAKQDAEFVPTVNANRTNVSNLSADMKLKLSDGNSSIGCGGSLRMLRDDVIQVNLTYKVLISINVGTMELTRDSILVLDRINNQYIRATYDEVPYLKKAGINFYSFQSLFWGELFVPNDQGAEPSKSDFEQTQNSDGITLTHQDNTLAIKFLTDAISGLIKRTKVTTSSNANMYVQTDYSDWSELGEGKFPCQTVLSLSDGKHGYQATFLLDDLKLDKKWDTRTSFNTKKYTRVSMDSIINQLMRMAN